MGIDQGDRINYNTGTAIVCKLCRLHYDTNGKKPRSFMPCGHTFCEKCINQLLERLCPNCKKPYNQAIVDYITIDLVKKAEELKTQSKEPESNVSFE